MTDVAPAELELAVYNPRPPGQVLTAEIEGGLPPLPPSDDYPQGHPGIPGLFVKFRAPDPEDGAVIEARCREAMAALLQGRGAERRYGFTSGKVLDEAAIAALAPFISAVESASLLVTDWNLAYPDAEGRPVKAPLSPDAIAELFRGRPLARAGWNLQYETVSPLERAEGNVSAASPDTTSATAANTAGDASSQDPDAAAAASDAPGGPVPAP